ncbi:MAG: CRP-like cAMP-binding protein [Roseivirga sp.]|jgi:CRP-like cAMP-binding protein
MFSQLIQAIKEFGDFSQEDQSFITRSVSVHTFKKGEFLLKKGETSQSLYFVNVGSLRHFKDIDGYSELTLNLILESDWVFDHHSFIGQKPSENYIQVFEDSTLLELTLDSLHALIKKSPSFFRLGKILENAETPNNVGIKTHEEKYLMLMEHTPKVIQRFPLKHIASFLGMTPETLSRVRARIKS